MNFHTKFEISYLFCEPVILNITPTWINKSKTIWPLKHCSKLPPPPTPHFKNVIIFKPSGHLFQQKRKYILSKISVWILKVIPRLAVSSWIIDWLWLKSRNYGFDFDSVSLRILQAFLSEFHFHSFKFNFTHLDFRHLRHRCLFALWNLVVVIKIGFSLFGLGFSWDSWNSRLVRPVLSFHHCPLYQRVSTNMKLWQRSMVKILTLRVLK